MPQSAPGQGRETPERAFAGSIGTGV